MTAEPTDAVQQPKLTFDGSAAEFVVESFGWKLDGGKDQIVRQDTGRYVKSFNGHPITIDELGGIVKGKDGNPVPIRDNFSDICDWVMWKRQQEQEAEDG